MNIRWGFFISAPRLSRIDMEKYRKKLGNLNMRQLSVALDIPFDVLLETVIQKKEIKAKEVPCVVQLGDFAEIGKLLLDVYSFLVDLAVKQKDNKKTFNKVAGMAVDVQNLLSFITKVLLEQNVPQEFIEKEFLNMDK